MIKGIIFRVLYILIGFFGGIYYASDFLSKEI